MSTQDEINISDAEFDAFLKGEGELTLMLRQLPQKQPSASLDDAILAAAKVELAKTPEAPAATVVQPVQQAANDPVIPGKAQSKRSFASRWRVPMGLVASLFVTVQLVRMEVYDERMKPGASALLVEKEPAIIAQAVESKGLVEPSVNVKILPPPGYEPPQGIVAKPAAPAPTTAEAIEAAQATAAAASRPEYKQRLRRQAVQDEQRLAAAPKMAPLPPAMAAAPIPAPAAQSAPSLFAEPAPVSNYRDNAGQKSPALNFGSVDASPAPVQDRVKESAPLAPAPAASNAFGFASPQAASVPAPMPVAPVAAAPAPLPPAAASVRVVVPDAEHKLAQTPPSAQVAVSDADARVAKIEALLKSGSTPEALAEWRKFRRAYPDYKVSDELHIKIDALLNQQTLNSGQ